MVFCCHKFTSTFFFGCFKFGLIFVTSLLKIRKPDFQPSIIGLSGVLLTMGSITDNLVAARKYR